MSDLSGTSIGPYQIEEQIGRGGMATVYKAYHPPTARHVAIKVLLPEIGQYSEYLARFDREAKAIAALQHVHILPVFDYGQHEGMPYLVMRYVPTGTLKDCLSAGPLSIKEALRLFSQIAEAVQYAHEKGILHRDLKPANVLLDDSGNALLSDFGLARLMGSTSSLTGANMMGTPAYMSPSQSQGKAFDTRSDIYSLGVILYEMVTGDVPFTAETPLGVIYKHASEPPPSPRRQRPDVPEVVEKVILKALAKKEEDRFQTVGEMLAALNSGQSAAGDEPLDETVLGSDLDFPQTALTEPPALTDEALSRSEAVSHRPISARWFRRAALVVGGLLILVVMGLILRAVLLSVALRTSSTTLAETALDGAAMLGADVDGTLRREILNEPDEARAVRLAKLYANRAPRDPDLSESLRSCARESAAAAQTKTTERCVRLLVIVDPQGAAALAGEFNDAGVAALVQTPLQESTARVYLDAVRLIDDSLGVERSNMQQSVSLYNQAQLIEQTDPTLAATIYHEAIYLDSNNISAYYALSSLLLVEFANDPAQMAEAVQVAEAGHQHIEARFCQGKQDLADPAVFAPSWLCFLLMTTEAGARLERGDDPALIMPLVERARRLAEANGQFGEGYYTAEVYYYLARLTEPDTGIDILCSIISYHNPALERHRTWALYANRQLGDRNCVTGAEPVTRATGLCFPPTAPVKIKVKRQQSGVLPSP
jgi:hypothetical protein